MLIKVRFFASHRERVGQDRGEFEVPSDGTLNDLIATVVGAFPRLGPVVGSARFAVNREYVPRTTVLRDGDEVAFIPPVAGGAARW